jgi:hypothetical protein
LPEKSESIEWACGDTPDKEVSRCATRGKIHEVDGFASNLGHWDTLFWTKPLSVRLLSLTFCQLKKKKGLR